MNQKRVAIIGGGASGLFASIILAREGIKADLYEKNTKLARKLNITGKGRCNLTTNVDKVAFFKAIRRNGKFLYSAFSQFDNFDTMAFFESLGVKLKVERGERVFPESDKASEISEALIREAKRQGVQFYLGSPIRALRKKTEGYTIVVGEKSIYYDIVIIATGGSSYPLTGTTGDGYQFAQSLGIKVEPPRGALVPLVVKEAYIKDLQGVSLKNVTLKLKTKTGKNIGEDFGEMLFTHFGISGPITLSLSGNCTDYWQKETAPIIAELDLKPALSIEQLLARLDREIEAQPKKALSNLMRRLLVQKMIAPFLRLAELNPDKMVNSLSKKEKLKIAQTLKNFSFTLTGARPIKEAIITAGGITVKEVMPKTMMLKAHKGLFAIGEILDMDAYTGGYNLQIAFSTAYAGAKGVSAFIKEEV